MPVSTARSAWTAPAPAGGTSGSPRTNARLPQPHAGGIEVVRRARRIEPADFDEFDLVLAVDDENLAQLHRMMPPGAHAEVRKLTADDIPDPYYGGPDGFEDVLDRLSVAIDDLIDDLRQD
jgi:protein-tyrosine phosphatase